MKIGVGSRHTAEPEEQKEGEVQLELVVDEEHAAVKVVEAIVWALGQLQVVCAVQEQEAWLYEESPERTPLVQVLVWEREEQTWPEGAVVCE
jgi:hypothetical protein